MNEDTELLKLSNTVAERVKFVKTTLENSLSISSKSYLKKLRNFTSSYIPQSNEEVCLPKYMYMNVHNSNIHNSYKLEGI